MDPETGTFPTVCPSCEKVAVMRIRAAWEAYGPDFDLPTRFTVADCTECQWPSMYIQEFTGSDGNTDFFDDRWQIYPPRVGELSHEVPERLRQDYAEAQRCFRAKGYTASAVMSRRVIEGICDDRGETSGTLASRLRALKDQGVIDARLFEWADACREVGNEGAHKVRTSVKREDAEDLMAFVEALADYLYVYRARFDRFTSRRANPISPEP